MAAARYDIVCEQGASFVRTLVWLDENEVPIQLNGYTARMHIRPTVTSSTLLAELTTENGGITLQPTTGGIGLTLTAAQTNALPARKAVYDLELESADGFVVRLVEGAFTINPQVTR
jgi:hypothetical protein